MATQWRGQWLRQTAAPYAVPERVVRDVDMVCAAHTSLTLSLDEYAADGSKLLNLAGTIPIMFRQQVYNIPVRIWLPLGYPREAPLCFVTPTATMLVKAGKHVDPSGRVYLPFLHFWPSRSDQANLNELIQTMSEVFSLEPPVYSRASVPPVSQPPQLQPQLPPVAQWLPTPTTPSPGRLSGEIKDIDKADEAQARKGSLVSGVNEALRRIAMVQRESLLSEMDALLIEQRALKENEQQLASSLAATQKALDEMRAETATVGELNGRLNRQINTLRQAKEVDLSTALKPATPLYVQLYDLVAEEKAIEDTIYILSKAHDHRRIGLEPFLKLVRSLAYQQFLKKAHIAKIAQHLGIPY